MKAFEFFAALVLLASVMAGATAAIKALFSLVIDNAKTSKHPLGADELFFWVFERLPALFQKNFIPLAISCASFALLWTLSSAPLLIAAGLSCAAFWTAKAVPLFKQAIKPAKSTAPAVAKVKIDPT